MLPEDFLFFSELIIHNDFLHTETILCISYFGKRRTNIHADAEISIIINLCQPSVLESNPGLNLLKNKVDLYVTEGYSGRDRTYPRAPYKLPGSPWRIHKRAPVLGEHNEAISVTEIGMSLNELADIKAFGIV